VTILVTVVIELQRNILKVSSEYLAVKCVSWCDEGSSCDLIFIINAEFSLWLTFTVSDLLLLEHENRSVICAV